MVMCVILLFFTGCIKTVTQKVEVQETKETTPTVEDTNSATEIDHEIEQIPNDSETKEIENISEEQENVAEELTQTNITSNTTSKSSSNLSTHSNASVEAQNVIIVKNLYFIPSELTIKKGETVVWIHEDNYKGYDNLKHKISIDNAGSNPIMKYGDTYQYTFNKPGTFVFVDPIYESTRGKIIVEE